MQKHFVENDPIKRYAAYLEQKGIVDEGGIEAIRADAAREVAEGEKFADDSPLPEKEDAFNDLFSFSPREFPEVVK